MLVASYFAPTTCVVNTNTRLTLRPVLADKQARILTVSSQRHVVIRRLPSQLSKRRHRAIDAVEMKEGTKKKKKKDECFSSIGWPPFLDCPCVFFLFSMFLRYPVVTAMPVELSVRLLLPCILLPLLFLISETVPAGRTCARHNDNRNGPGVGKNKNKKWRCVSPDQLLHRHATFTKRTVCWGWRELWRTGPLWCCCRRCFFYASSFQRLCAAIRDKH